MHAVVAYPRRSPLPSTAKCVRMHVVSFLSHPMSCPRNLCPAVLLVLLSFASFQPEMTSPSNFSFLCRNPVETPAAVATRPAGVRCRAMLNRKQARERAAPRLGVGDGAEGLWASTRSSLNHNLEVQAPGCPSPLAIKPNPIRCCPPRDGNGRGRQQVSSSCPIFFSDRWTRGRSIHMYCVWARKKRVCGVDTPRVCRTPSSRCVRSLPILLSAI